MPQELRVVRCYHCMKFQTDIVKKAPKWTCKMCGSKQSLVKEFVRGSGRECRLFVQQLSGREMDEQRLEQLVAEQVMEGHIELLHNPVQEESERVASHQESIRVEGISKWENFRVKDSDEADKKAIPLMSNRQNSINKSDILELNSKQAYPPSSFNICHPVQSLETKSTTQLMDFHRMDKNEKRQFKWKSRNSSNYLQSQPLKPNSSKSNSLPNMADVSSKHLTNDGISCVENENVARKRSEVDIFPMMNFSKKSKWEHSSSVQKLSTEVTLTPSAAANDIHRPSFQQTSSISSGSKWSKFVSRNDDLQL
ncbi:MRN complex-interacting protein [Topomyia yanbarensis]|uniref:MRN complex-interacting protein n=1 Tax=Topomyia yanbarensis TaxID=2498891 RepID=UPI00273CD597|nr:MRN complex-interacting protein [Topomyia yanbarensis]